MHPRLPSEDPDSIHVQPSPVANDRKAFTVYYQGRQVGGVLYRTRHRGELHYSKKYIELILSQLPATQLHLSTPVRAVWSGQRCTILETRSGEHETFDHIIFACHSDDVLRILGAGATPAEREALNAFRWRSNEVWLHSDKSVGLHSPCLSLLLG
jgi:hypothetical protein